ANVMAGTSTPSPARRPSASTARWSAAGQELSAIACGALTAAAKAPSNRFTRGPVVSQPDRSVATTSSTSASPIEGRKKGTSIFTIGSLVLDASGTRTNQPFITTRDPGGDLKPHFLSSLLEPGGSSISR